ncbi:MAG: hypothetical protein VKK04_04340 [Synechococcales bacterium]|nr:hypothetical protein [Synechococcales bacterium]
MSSRNNRHITPEEQMIYDHLLHWIERETPEQMIQRFRALFIDGTRYSEPAIISAIEKVTASHLASEEFRYVLNRCCHILVNRWQSRPQYQLAIPLLIELIETVPDGPVAGVLRHSRSTRRLRELMKQFLDTEQFLTLRRLAQVLSQSVEPHTDTDSAGSTPLGNLIRRYPYLYSHCLLSDDSTQEQQYTVQQIQAKMQRQFELDLSKYVTYQLRCASLRSAPSSTTPKIIYPVKNPTLLSDRTLNRAIKHYVGRIDGNRTYRDLAESFAMQVEHSRSYRAFKDDLYQYLISGVDQEYGARQFNDQFYRHLCNIFPESESKPVTDFLVVRTCSQLLNFLIVDNPKYPSHYVFVDLLTNMGPILTMGLLLRILLLCRKIRPYLERRFSILFNHYESCNRDAVSWLISALEMLNVALATNFGKLDLSLVAR